MEVVFGLAFVLSWPGIQIHQKKREKLISVTGNTMNYKTRRVGMAGGEEFELECQNTQIQC